MAVLHLELEFCGEVTKNIKNQDGFCTELEKSVLIFYEVFFGCLRKQAFTLLRVMILGIWNGSTASYSGS